MHVQKQHSIISLWFVLSVAGWNRSPLVACLPGLPVCATFAGQAGCFGEGRCPATPFNPSQVNRSSYMYAAATFGVYGDLCALEKIIMMRSIYVFRLTELFVSVNIGSMCLEKLSYGTHSTMCAHFV